MQESANLVRAGLLVQLSQVKLYQQICQRSLQFGIAGPLTLETVKEFQSQMEGLIRSFST